MDLTKNGNYQVTLSRDEIDEVAQALLEKITKNEGTRLDWIRLGNMNTGYGNCEKVIEGIDEDLVTLRKVLDLFRR